MTQIAGGRECYLVIMTHCVRKWICDSALIQNYRKETLIEVTDGITIVKSRDFCKILSNLFSKYYGRHI